MICADNVTVSISKIYSKILLSLSKKNFLLNHSVIGLFNNIIPIVPPKDNIKPTSQIIYGLYKRIKTAVVATVESALGCCINISAIIKIIAITPARTTDGLAPEIKTNKITVKIVI